MRRQILGSSVALLLALSSCSSDRNFSASISFGDPWAAAERASGIVTGRHEVGTVVEPGEKLVRVDDAPIFLGRGSVPLYRELNLVSTRLRDETGHA